VKGGPRAGSGRPPKLKDTVRNKILRVSVTETEYEVMELLGKSWDVPTATAAYGLLADSIAACRKANALAMPERLIVAASQIVAKHKPEQQMENPA
jgi:hypothetical protein